MTSFNNQDAFLEALMEFLMPINDHLLRNDSRDAIIFT